MKKIVVSILVLGVLGGGYPAYKYLKNHSHKPGPVYRTVKIERGLIVQEVGATGTVQPIKNILVGTQVNGPIKKLYADFNDEVKAGQVIAQIDPVVYEANVAKDKAQLTSNKATAEQTKIKLVLAEKELKRGEQLLKTNMISESEYDALVSSRDSLVAQLKTAEAAILQSEASLQLSTANLGYTRICSPVDGVIIERNVDEGQTVVSSMNAQTIFTIATDLNNIQVQADIPESDVGNIHAGQKVTFTVDAYRHTFTGKVTQVRMSSTTVQNVVTFPVIVEAHNHMRKLFPGMTANIAIETDRKENILTIPLAALRFNPRSSDDSQAPTKRRESGIWVCDETNGLVRVPVRQIISDLTSAGIETAEAIEGREVVLGIRSATAIGENVNNPFAPKMPGSQQRKAMK